MTQRQQLVAKAIAEKTRKGEKISIYHEMVNAGYSRHTAKNCKITRTKNWQTLMEEYLPKSDLLEIHNGLLNETSWRARSDALDKAYKLKGLYSAQKHQLEFNGFTQMTDEELEQAISEGEKQFKKVG